MMPHKPSGGEIYWRKFAADNNLGHPLSVEDIGHGYRVVFKGHSIDTNFLGPPRNKKKLISDLQRWIDGR